jgi:hypothetical protein
LLYVGLDLWHPFLDYESRCAIPLMRAGEVAGVFAAPMGTFPPGGRQPGGDMLASWAQGLGQSRAAVQSRGCVRFAFYGRVSTEDWQDPVTSRARQLAQAVMLTAGHGAVVAQFFDAGSPGRCRGPGARRPPRWSRSSRTRTAGGTRS